MTPRTRNLRPLSILWPLAGIAACMGCSEPQHTSSTTRAISDVDHTQVERQSIGNCWLYSQASWVESMNLAARRSAAGGADVEQLDVSQSYWTYWHWFDDVTEGQVDDEIQTGGFQFLADAIVRDRGVMLESNFVPEDVASEMSDRQASALDRINSELKDGALSSSEARRDGKLVREIFDDAWKLSDEVRGQLDQAFGEDGERTLRQDADLTGTDIIDPATLPVRYTERVGDESVPRDANLLDAIRAWDTARYPFDPAGRRAFQQRVQRALHDRQPVVITWNVDFNALENSDNDRRGSFNLKTLVDSGGPGRQGGHMTVLEDYEAETDQFGVLQAAVTLDPSNPDDAKKLEAALAPSTRIKFVRTKNSWGALRPDRAFAKDFPGYHDLWIDYLDGPIKFCPGEDNPTSENCTGETAPWREVLLPPGY